MISTAQTFDFEQGDTQFAFVVRVVDKGNPQLSSDADVTVTVVNANDLNPVFDLDVYRKTLAETQDTDVAVVTVNAEEQDGGGLGGIAYEILNGANDTFSIDSVSGAIVTTQPLDFEDIKSYTLVVQAVDQGQPPRSAVATVEVTVTDINDNAPILDQEVINITIEEDLSVGSAIATFDATDEDSGVNGQIAYVIASGPAQFTIPDPRVGRLDLAQAVDFETAASFQVVVRAEDGASTPLTDTLVVNIQVTDVNDNAPVFNPESGDYSCQITEGLDAGQSCVTLVASDAVSGELLSSQSNM